MTVHDDSATPIRPDSRSERLIAAISEWVVRHPGRAMLLGLFLVFAAAFGARGYHYSLDHRVFFSPENPQLQAFEKLNADYSKTDAVLVALAPQSGNVFEPGFLAALAGLTEKSWQVPYVQRVESLTNFQHVTVAGDSIVTADLVADPAGLDAGALARLRDVAVNEPFLVDSLVNRDGSVAAVRITLNMPGVDHINEIPAVVDYVRGLADEVRKTHPDIAVHLAGQTIANKAFPEESQADFVRVWPWFILTMALLLVYLYRSVAAMLVTFVACDLAVLGGAGFVGFFDPVINDSVIVSPVMILSLAFADGIHIVVSWIQGMHAGRDRRQAMVDSLKANIGPMTMTTLMTAIGFLTLHFNDSPPFRVMGYIVAAGVVFALLLTVLFTAPLLSWLPLKAPKKISPLMSEDSPAMGRFADWVIRHRWRLLAVMGVLAAALIACIPRNVVNDDIVKYYTPGTTFRQDMEFVNDNLTGIGEINYSLPAGPAGQAADGIVEPAYLRQVDAFAQWLKTQPGVTQVNSLADIVKRINQTMHGNDPAYYVIPDDRAEIAQYLLQYEMSLPYGMDLNHLLRFDRSESRVRVAVGSSSGQQIIGIDADAQRWLRDNAPAYMQVQGASLSLMFAHIGERSITGMFSGMIGALILESLAVMVLFAAFRLGFVSFIGNLVPIGMGFGAWALWNGNIDLGLTIVLGIAISVVVDDTIHFISKYERGRRRYGHTPEQAIRYAFRSVGFALLTTTLVLGLGFAWLANSNIQVTVNTALVTTTIIVFALLIDLLLLPVLFLLLDKRPSAAPVVTGAPAAPVGERAP
ncbi:MAG: efflux RND transporter permease subunit [Pseudomonadota bacterium]